MSFKFIITENSKSSPKQYEMVYNSNPPKLRSIGTINSLYELHDLMSKSLEIIAPYKDKDNTKIVTSDLYPPSGYNITNSIQNYGIFFAPDFPEGVISRDRPDNYKCSPISARNIITWGVVRKEPGTTSQDVPFRGTREVKARTREYILFYNNIMKKRLVGIDSTQISAINDTFGYMKIKAQVFDNLIQYNIFGKTNYEAERLVEWFEDEYMDNYIGMFREAGVVDMYFDRRVRDDVLLQKSNGYHVRSVLYYIRTERVRPEFIGPIKQINLNIDTKDLQSLTNIEEGYSIESRYDKLISKWIHRNKLGG